MKWLFFPSSEFWVDPGPELYTIRTEQTLTIVGAKTNAPSVLWKQVAGATVTINNAQSIRPTIVFGAGYNSSDPIILKLSVVGRPGIFAYLQINTRLTSITSTPSSHHRNLSITSNSRFIRFGGFKQPPAFREQVKLVEEPGGGTLTRAKYYLSWVPPTDLEGNIKGYTLLHNTNGVYRTVATYGLDPDTWYFPTNLGIHYRLVVGVEIGGNTTEYISSIYCTEDNLLGPGPSFVADDLVIAPSSTSKSTAIRAELNFSVQPKLESVDDQLWVMSPLSLSTPISLELALFATVKQIEISSTTDSISAFTSLGKSTATKIPLAWNSQGIFI